ncbi:spore germination lipoprotein GerD [Bacillus sp. FJAT-49736]|uniref:spore germination lipoprotein GerD n=1 Tax=Bacillus sp. FJAT-49736 TaxID=2833582 RepID=UPI001BCA03B0|nr:spore germination lipoprotein GerD [Bacillus sp. FJAT-49736]MBS4175662.1 spore gernimation protein GerD [Bacillus sp. FJAT-49736]
MKKFALLLLTPMIILLASCSGSETKAGQMDYDQTKKMIVDILKTDEGKKAIQDIMTDDKMRNQLIMDQSTVTKTIESTLSSNKGKDFWKKSFSDPEFAKAYAKGMKKENENLLKSLMKDPDYQGMMLSLLKDPEYQKQVIQLMKSKEMRKHFQNTMIETFDSPLFKAKMQTTLLKAAQEMNSEKGGQQNQGQQQGGTSGGQQQGSSGGS